VAHALHPFDQEKGTQVKLTLKEIVSRSATLSALPVVIALLLSGAISFSYNRFLKNNRDAVDHTFQVMSGIDSALLRLQDAETGQRGFIITGDEAYLAPFKSAEQELSEILVDLGRMVSDNADQQAKLANLQQLADGKLSELQETILTRKEEGLERARLKVVSSTGKETMDRIRSVAVAMRTTEHRLLEARLSSARWAEQIMVLVAVICVVLSLAGRLLAVLIKARMRESVPEERSG
jgi:methyl-accepting chemotaxis protein